MLIAEGVAVFDAIVFDGPPIMGLADAPMIGAVVTGCVLVIEAGQTTHAQVRQSLRRMSLAGAHMLGAVLTKCRSRGDPYGYGYGYGLGALPPGAPGGSSRETGGVAGVVARARRVITR